MLNIIPNFLDQEVIDLILEKYEYAKGKPFFEINEMGRWAEELYAGNFGPVYILPMFTELCNTLNPKFYSLPEFTDYQMNACFLHVWQPGSGINWHLDNPNSDERIGFTVYLNQEWNVNWGGLLLWEKFGQTGWYSPQYNNAVWFHSPFWHSVTMVSRAANTPRLSLQIFLDRKK